MRRCLALRTQSSLGGQAPRIGDSRLAESGDTIDAADEQHAFLVDRSIPQGIRCRPTDVFRPDPIELLGNVLAAWIFRQAALASASGRGCLTAIRTAARKNS